MEQGKIICSDEYTNIVTYGGGINTIALILLLIDQGKRIDYILFSDTKGEKPETYDYIPYFNEYLKSKGYTEITWLEPYKPEGLYGECFRLKTLPSIAYGFKSCSEKWKIRPCTRFLKENKIVKVRKFVGYDIDEDHRIKNYDSKNTIVEYPLVEAEMDRTDCMKIIIEHGLRLPVKSACFFCPSTKKSELFELQNNHPELVKDAIVLERNADLTSIAGLGRNYSWEHALNQTTLPFYFETKVKISCECGL